jgi:hypothetical protein
MTTNTTTTPTTRTLTENHPSHTWDDSLDPEGTPRCYWCDCRPYGKVSADPCPYNPNRDED